jgi:hypothetical protein
MSADKLQSLTTASWLSGYAYALHVQDEVEGQDLNETLIFHLHRAASLLRAPWDWDQYATDNTTDNTTEGETK